MFIQCNVKLSFPRTQLIFIVNGRIIVTKLKINKSLEHINKQTMSEEIKKKREVSVTINAESESPTRMKLRSGKFEMIIDEPASMGGSDMGPSPIQVLLMSLAGCINVTGHEVARQRKMKLNGMKIKIDGTMNPCTFIGCSYEERAGFQTINMKVNADFENATKEEIDSWLKETEERCPVTDNIRESTKINIVKN